MEKNCITKYVTDHGNVELSPEIIKSYLVPSDSKITDPEIGFFLQMCKFQKLNPFMKEIYIVKYGNYPAAFIIAKDTFLKRAKKNDTYQGHTVGISDDGKSAWAEVFIKDFEKPIRVDVELEEYIQLKDGQPNKMWKAKPKTMLKKVALVQVLREAFPQDLGGLYDQSEMDDTDEVIKEANATVTNAKAKSDSESTEKKSSESQQSDHRWPNQAGDTICKIKNVTQKSGVLNGKKWKRYNIEAVDGTIYTTFDKKFAEEASKIKGKDAEAMLMYVVVDGKYFNLIENKGLKLI